MSIKNILLAGAAVTFLASTAMAAEPTKLTDAQMDDVAGGFTLTGAVALTGGVAGFKFATLKFKEKSTTSTKETIVITKTGLNGLQQTDSSAYIRADVTAKGGAAEFASGGTLAVGFSLSD